MYVRNVCVFKQSVDLYLPPARQTCHTFIWGAVVSVAGFDSSGPRRVFFVVMRSCLAIYQFGSLWNIPGKLAPTRKVKLNSANAFWEDRQLFLLIGRGSARVNIFQCSLARSTYNLSDRRYLQTRFCICEGEHCVLRGFNTCCCTSSCMPVSALFVVNRGKNPKT